MAKVYDDQGKLVPGVPNTDGNTYYGNYGYSATPGGGGYQPTAAPTAPGTPQYTAQQNAPGQTAQKPVYSGLMDGDYNKLQASLATGGRQAAENAYNTGSQNLNNTMSGRGLYGSSIMQQQQTQGLDREYMRALAANESQAAATRYGMQQQDLKTGYEGAMQGYGIDTQANIAANDIAGRISMNNANNLTQQYGIDSTANTAANGFLSAQAITNANNATTLSNTGLLGENAVNVADINAASAANTAQKQFDSNAARDQTTLDQADIVAATNRYGIDVTSATAKQDLQAKIDIARRNGDMALVGQLLNAGIKVGLDVYSYA